MLLYIGGTKIRKKGKYTLSLKMQWELRFPGENEGFLEKFSNILPEKKAVDHGEK